jgi:ATP-dependent DNA ligase
MEALSVAEVPTGEQWQYEPKWDGFRCLVYRDGQGVALQSKSGQPLTRYFPDIVGAIQQIRARRLVLDGEIMVPRDGAFSFDALLQRIHPTASRVIRLAKETPAMLIVFDLLVDERGKSLIDLPLEQRRQRLEEFAGKYLHGADRVRLSPVTTRLGEARKWLKSAGTTLDGIIAKRRDVTYRSGDRSAMRKIKNYRSADCVVGGFRYLEAKKLVGSLLLGLYDKHGLLHHVGFTATIKNTERPALTTKLQTLIAPPGFTGHAPGGQSRWSTKRSAEWQPLKANLVVEVLYDHFTGDRFRHGTRLMRWRPDKSPKQCTLDQVKQKKANLMKLLK